MDAVLRNFFTLGCSDQAKCYAAYQLYLELCQTFKYIKYEYNVALDTFWIIGKEAEDSLNAEIFLPIIPTIAKAIDFVEIEKVQQSFLLKSETGKCNFEIIVALVDSNIIYYKMSNRFVDF